MTRTFVALLALVLVSAGTGCVTGRGLLNHRSACNDCGGGGCQSCGIFQGGGSACDSCDGSGCQSCGGLLQRGGGGCRHLACGLFGGCGLGSRLAAHHTDPGAVSGPPAAQVAYPYYTVRGPRDFFLDDPPPLGP